MTVTINRGCVQAPGLKERSDNRERDKQQQYDRRGNNSQGARSQHHGCGADDG